MGGAVGGLTGGLLGGDTPSFDSGAARASQKQTAQDQALYGNYGVRSSLGDVNIVKNEDGTVSKEFSDSAADQTRNQLIGQGLGGLSLDPTSAEDAYFNRATRRLTPQFEQDRESLEQRLANKGIQAGTEQYNREFDRFDRNRQDTLADIGDKSVFSGQQLLGSQIGNVGALAGQRDINRLPGLGGSTGAQFQDTYAQQLQADQQKAQGEQQQNQALLMGGLGFLGSDERLKENLEKVGELDNGLNVYIGNYKEETGLDMTPQLFLVAQEVQAIKPEAVKELDGYLMVNYKEAV